MLAVGGARRDGAAPAVFKAAPAAIVAVAAVSGGWPGGVVVASAAFVRVSFPSIPFVYS